MNLADTRSHFTGEMSAIKNCTAILTDPHGKYRMTASQAEDAFADLTLYTNAESCPMVCYLYPHDFMTKCSRTKSVPPQFDGQDFENTSTGLRSIH